MRYLVALYSFVLPTLLFGGGAAQDTQAVALRLVSMKGTQVAGESSDLQLFLVNNGNAPAYVALWDYDQIQVEIHDKPIKCALASRGTPGVQDVKWQRIDPSASLSIGVPGFWCPEDAGPVSNNRDWRQVPGKYKLSLTVSVGVPADAQQRSGPAPKGAFEGILRSNAVEISVTEPASIDADALRWARQNNHDPVSIEVATRFPASRYAALLTWQALMIGNKGPEDVKALIDKGLYPEWHSIPDLASPNGWRSISAGKDMASWRIEQGERLLHEQIGFPYERGVRLSVAISYSVIGDKPKAARLLKLLADEQDTPEGRWAKSFSALQGQ